MVNPFNKTAGEKTRFGACLIRQVTNSGSSHAYSHLSPCLRHCREILFEPLIDVQECIYMTHKEPPIRRTTRDIVLCSPAAL